MAQGLGMLLVVLLILIVLFLIAREYVCWYWKINERLSELQQIRTSLQAIELKLGAAAGATGGAVAGATGAAPARVVEAHRSTGSCSKCSKPLSPGDRFCEYCGTPVQA